tara:strand:+ start:235 stop:1491 length:1257 start_codon:yes stop_codon:yes gene_type:complete
MSKYKCTVCNWVYDESIEDKKFKEVSGSWHCPVCNAGKKAFILLSDKSKILKIKQTVSDVFIEQISEWGVKFVFGLPGTSSLGVLEAIRKNPKINYFQVRHEQTAAFMASAYGKLTNHIAACLTVAGPGATNLTTGLYDAKLDHSPVLALTGQVTRKNIGPGSFQEIDQHSFFEPICVFNKTLMSEKQTTSLATLGIKHAIIERGVSHISFPNDIQKLPHREKIQPMKGRIVNKTITACQTLIKKAAEEINKAKKPVIIAGFGAMQQGKVLLALAKKISAPIATTFRSKGIINEDNDLSIGCHGGIGTTTATTLVKDSDLLIVIGSSFSEMTNIPNKKTIQIDINPMIIAKTHPVEVPLWGNSSIILPKLLREVNKKNNPSYLRKIKKLKTNWEKQIRKEINTKKITNKTSIYNQSFK